MLAHHAHDLLEQRELGVRGRAGQAPPGAAALAASGGRDGIRLVKSPLLRSSGRPSHTPPEVASRAARMVASIEKALGVSAGVRTPRTSRPMTWMTLRAKTCFSNNSDVRSSAGRGVRGRPAHLSKIGR